jgi:hypothetical protein
MALSVGKELLRDGGGIASKTETLHGWRREL